MEQANKSQNKIMIIIRLHLQDIFIPVSYLLIFGRGNLIRDVSTGGRVIAVRLASGTHQNGLWGLYLGILRVGESGVVLEVDIGVFFCGYCSFGWLFEGGDGEEILGLVD